MARMDEIRPDQRAALQLLLQQGRSYEDIANLLRIDGDAVRERAHAALDALGPEDVPGLSLADQDEVADYLLGQQSASQRAATRDLLESSAGARAWARAVAGELRPMAGDNLPEIPSEAAEVDEAFDALEARAARRERVERSSRVGGAILIAAAVIGLFGLVFLGISLLGGDDDDDDGNRSGTTTTQTQANEPRVVAQINLLPPEGSGGKHAGVAQIAERNGTRAIAMVAEGFAPARRNPPRFYALWLYNSPEDTQRLGFPPAPERGRIAVSFELPRDADKFERLIVTQESEQQPERPGRILLTGPLEGTPVNTEGTSTAPPTQPATEPSG